MPKRLILIICLLVMYSCLMAACSIPVEPIPVAIASTSTPITQPSATSIPAPIPTSIPLAAIDLKPLMFMPDDLVSYSIGPVRTSSRVSMFRDVLTGQNEIDVRLTKGGEIKGGISTFVYDSSGDTEFAWGQLTKLLANEAIEVAQPVSDLGERALVAPNMSDIGGQSYELVFHRCHAVVYIRLSVANIGDLLRYARHVDSRLTSKVCPESAQ